ncbi:MAG: hypothetical protein Q8L09_00670 [Candidatus Moranbacteria bacterium]|nr:hypothetical protein [Candidatus Moranbacteria bacterium]
MSTFGLDNSQNIEKNQSRFHKTRNIWLKYEEKIILAIGIILIAGISFEAGFLQGEKNKKEPVVINKTADSTECAANETANTASANQPTEQSPAQNTTVTETKNCPYVASKNSNKYHLASCQFATKIKPENKVCFSSAEEAQKRGFQGAKCCIK